ncbi:MAG: hypothetical protein ABEJ86_03315 [Halococcoides sp.]
MTGGRWAAGTAGLLLGVALVALVAPLPDPVRSVGEALARSEGVVTVVAGLLGLVAAVVIVDLDPRAGLSRLLGGTGTRRIRGRSRRPDDDQAQPEAIPGSEIETALDRLRERDGAVPVQTERQRIRRRLTEAAIDTVSEAEGISHQAAADRVAAGTWTDDPRAAAFLGDDRAPLWVRIRDWLFGPPTERRARATVAEIAALRGVNTEVEHP